MMELLGSLQLGLWFCDLPFSVLEWDVKVKEHFGFPPDTTVSIDMFYDRLHPDDRERTREAIERAIATHTNYDIEYRTVGPEKMRWIRALGRTFYGVDGAAIRFDGVTIDISDEKEIREQLENSREDMREVLARITDGFSSIDKEWVYTYINPSGAQMIGRTPEEVVGRKVLDLFPDILDTPFGAALRRAQVEQKVVEIEEYYAPLDKWMSARIFPSAAGLSSYYRDVTEAKRTEMRLRESDEKFRMIADSMSQLAWIADETGYIFWYNRRWYEYTGARPEEMEGWGWKAVQDPNVLPEVIEQWQKSLGTGLPFEMTFPLKRADGVYRSFLTRAVPAIDETGAIVRWFGTNTDITAQIEAERALLASEEKLLITLEELRRARDAAESANRAKSDFLANMSHELRTPLNAIIGYSEMLQEEAQEVGASAMVQDLTKIHSSGRHLLSLIGDILDLAKIEAGKMELFPDTFAVRSAVQDVIDTVEPLVVKNGNRLELSAPPELGLMHSDLTKLRQILFNLLSNAAKFTQNGLIRVTVDLVEADRLRFAVTDTGRGIPADRLDHLFQPFKQLGPAGRDREGGTGLGLAITKRFCEIMGGEISVESAVAEGSTFTIELPRSAPGAIETPAPKKESAIGTPGGELAGHAVVLVIDDDPAARDILQRHLHAEGCRAVTAANGEEGIRIAKSARPDIITLNIMMPGMDGWLVLQHLKADPELASIPVVMTAMLNECGLGYTLGAAEYLTKPVSREALAKVLRKHHSAKGQCRVLIVDDDADTRALLAAQLKQEGCYIDQAGDGLEALKVLKRSKPPGLKQTAVACPRSCKPISLRVVVTIPANVQASGAITSNPDRLKNGGIYHK